MRFLSFKIEIHGKFVDGLCDGVIDETWYMDDGKIYYWTIAAKDGKYLPIKDLPVEISNNPDYEEFFEEDEFVVSIAKGNYGYTALFGNSTVLSGVSGMGFEVDRSCLHK